MKKTIAFTDEMFPVIDRHVYLHPNTSADRVTGRIVDAVTRAITAPEFTEHQIVVGGNTFDLRCTDVSDTGERWVLSPAPAPDDETTETAA